jgi:hypothetical protein
MWRLKTMETQAINKLISEGYTQLNSTIIGGNYKEIFVRGNETVTYKSETGLFYYNSGDGNYEVWEFSNGIFYGLESLD